MRRALVLGFCVAACQFEHGKLTGTSDASVDAPAPITCGELTCDPNAICTNDASGATCACAMGYDGDGMTCTAIDACATANGGCPAACESTGPGTSACYVPQTCANVAAHKTVPNDSNVTLYAGGDPAKPWTAFCHNGLEYLTAASATSNFGQYTASSKSPGTNVRTTYARLRIVPAMLAIDICDRAFATSTGMLSHDPANHNPDIAVTSMPLGVAMDCAALVSSSPTGVAAINLTSTPFVVTSNWSTGGNGGNGTANKSGGGRTVAITGGGNCGWHEPSGGPADPFNTCTDLELITLQYSP